VPVAAIVVAIAAAVVPRRARTRRLVDRWGTSRAYRRRKGVPREG
jgi:hypothetical protein